MIHLYKTPKLAKIIYPSLIWEKESMDTIYLTFDDGPHPEITNWVLDELEKVKAKATFFCIGDHLQKFNETAVRIISKAHRIANHTQEHLRGWDVDDDTYFESIADCGREIKRLQGSSKLFRPPYGRIKKTQIKKLRSTYQIIMWSHLSWDFDKKLNIGKSVASLKKAKPGSIVVFHDSEKAFQNLKQLLPEVLLHWSSLNYKFETLDVN